MGQLPDQVGEGDRPNRAVQADQAGIRRILCLKGQVSGRGNQEEGE